MVSSTNKRKMEYALLEKYNCYIIHSHPIAYLKPYLFL